MTGKMKEKMSEDQVFTIERQQQICDILQNKRKLVVRELCDCFNVSAQTIRSDLRELEEKGVLIRTHGGAILNTTNDGDRLFHERNSINSEEKDIIGETAALLVSDGETIIIDSGTTALAFTRKLVRKKNLRIITCDFKIASFLEENTDASVYFLGGIVKRGFYCTVGPSVIRSLSELCADKCFLGTTGISTGRGITCSDTQHSEVRREMIKISRQTIVLAESRKIGINCFSVTTPIQNIDFLVTDDKILPDERNQLENAGVEVYTPSTYNPSRE